SACHGEQDPRRGPPPRSASGCDVPSSCGIERLARPHIDNCFPFLAHELFELRLTDHGGRIVRNNFFDDERVDERLEAGARVIEVEQPRPVTLDAYRCSAPLRRYPDLLAP